MATHDNLWNSMFQPDPEKERIKHYSGWTNNELSAGYRRNKSKELLLKDSVFKLFNSGVQRAAADSVDNIEWHQRNNKKQEDNYKYFWDKDKYIPYFTGENNSQWRDIKSEWLAPRNPRPTRSVAVADKTATKGR